jgi:hypothetical protein
VTDRATKEATVWSLIRSIRSLAICASAAFDDCREPSIASIISGVSRAHESAIVCSACSAATGLRALTASSAVRINCSSAARRMLTLTVSTASDFWKCSSRSPNRCGSLQGIDERSERAFVESAGVALQAQRDDAIPLRLLTAGALAQHLGVVDLAISKCDRPLPAHALPIPPLGE